MLIVNISFIDRHWTDREFEELAPDQSGNQKYLLEIGCGVGNFVFPALAENSSLFIYACDFSKRAIDMVKSNEQYDESRCKAFVCDLTQDLLTDQMEPNSLDLVSEKKKKKEKSNVGIRCLPFLFFQLFLQKRWNLLSKIFIMY